MKKIMTAVFALVLAGILTVGAFALTPNEEVKVALDNAQATIGFSDSSVICWYNLTVNYLSSHTLTEEQAAIISEKFASCSALLKSYNVTTVKNLSEAQIKAVIAEAQPAAKAIDATIIYNATEKSVSIKTTGDDVIFYTAKPVGNTGADLTAVLAFGAVLITVLAGAVVVAFRKKLFVH